MRTRFISVLLITALSAPAAFALPLTIDNFEEGNFTVVDLATPPASTFGEQTGLNSANTIGGVRLVRASAEGGATATATLLTTGPGDDGALLTAAGGIVPEGGFAFIYDGVAGGISNGSTGTLNLDLSTFTAITVTASTIIPTGADIRVTIWDSNSSRSTAFRPLLNGINTFELAGGLSVGIDLNDIKAIQIALQEVEPATSLSILDISAIPEPTTGLLLSVGLVGLAVARRR